MRQKLTELKEAQDAIDDTLRRGVEARLKPPTGGSQQKRARQPEHILTDDTESFADEGYLEPTPLAVQDAAYTDEADDDVEDLGFRIGRMRMGERIGGFYRPKIADEVRNRRIPQFPIIIWLTCVVLDLGLTSTEPQNVITINTITDNS